MVEFKNHKKKKNSKQLGILAFETANTMSRLLSLYKSLSDEEIFNLKNNVIKSQGVTFLNSKDETFLLGLACAERLEDLDHAASAVSRLGKRCNDVGLNRFDLVYADLKHGTVCMGKCGYGTRVIERKVQKMEKSVNATSCLHAALEALTEMEVSERKLQQWKMNNGTAQNANVQLFNQKIEFQRKEVRHFREVSLWSKSFDKSVGSMAKIICILYARMGVVFRKQRDFPQVSPVKEHFIPHSAPILSAAKPRLVRFYSLRSSEDNLLNEKYARNNRVLHAAGSSTLGGAGLALLYANVIILTEKYLNSESTIGNDSRESLYQMLPENVKVLVRTKLSKNMKYTEQDLSLAEGWREAMKEIMAWLAPMAHNTVVWQMERNFEKMKFSVKPNVLLLQTLHFSDKEKTEAAIVEVLVGLSCIYRFENRKLCD